MVNNQIRVKVIKIKQKYTRIVEQILATGNSIGWI
jgi:hypothetical protein